MMVKFTKRKIDKLLFRRQFIIGPYFLDNLTSWKKLKISTNSFLQVHPDLEVNQIKNHNIELTSLGYLIDPYHPEIGNREILINLLSEIENIYDIFNKTKSLSGRWIIILDDGSETILFNDACGLRQVYYTDFNSQQIWCASQPGIIAEELNLDFDSNAKNFFQTISKQHKEYWWPGNSSPYRGIVKLAPNHWLDFKKRKCFRFYPNEKLNNISIKEGVEKSSELLKRLIGSAANRFDIAFSTSAGWDSRLLLAASKEYCDKFYFFSKIFYNLSEKSPDIVIPSILLKKFGLKHNVIICPSSVDRYYF